MKQNFPDRERDLKALSIYLAKQQGALTILLLILIIVGTRDYLLFLFLGSVLLISSFLLFQKLRHLKSATLEEIETMIYFQKRGVVEGSFFIDDGKKVLGLKKILIPYIGKKVRILWDPKSRYIISIEKK